MTIQTNPHAPVRIRVGVALAAVALLSVVAPSTHALAETAKALKVAAKKASNGTANAAAPASREEAEAALTVFCSEWMHKLEVRERDNVAHIKWDSTSGGVQGIYVGYSHEHTCKLTDDSQVPVAKIGYREVTYAKRGSSIAEAQTSTPQPIEVNEVTEIFSYNKGKWDF